jgi:hypothetical protein
MAKDRQVIAEIHDAPEIVTSFEFKQHEQRLLVNALASQERLNGRFHQSFTELTATLSSTLIIELAPTKRVNIQPPIPVGVDDTPEGGITWHDARSAHLSTKQPLITPTMRPMAPPPATTVIPIALSHEDCHIDT